MDAFGLSVNHQFGVVSSNSISLRIPYSLKGNTTQTPKASIFRLYLATKKRQLDILVFPTTILEPDTFENCLARKQKTRGDVIAGEPEIAGLADDLVDVYPAPPRKTTTSEIVYENVYLESYHVRGIIFSVFYFR